MTYYLNGKKANEWMIFLALFSLALICATELIGFPEWKISYFLSFFVLVNLIYHKNIFSITVDEQIIRLRYTRFLIPITISYDLNTLELKVRPQMSLRSKKRDYLFVYKDGKKVEEIDSYSFLDEDDFQNLITRINELKR